LKKTKTIDVMMEAISKIVRFSIVFNLCLDETLIYRFKNQISSLVIDIITKEEQTAILDRQNEDLSIIKCSCFNNKS